MFHIATDEAGYGPTLGPLVICGTAWTAPDDLLPQTWYAHLEPLVTTRVSALGVRSTPGRSPKIKEATEQPGRRAPSICIMDSKKLYHGPADFGRLEQAAWAILGQVIPVACSFHDLIARLDSAAMPWLTSIPWFAEFHQQLPLTCPLEQVQHAGEVLSSALRNHGVALTEVGISFLPAARFNQLLAELTKKSDLLTVMTLQLVRRLSKDRPSARVWADKHGGRNQYLPYLARFFPGAWINVLKEAPGESEYEILETGGKTVFSFLAKGEALFIVAACSVVAKYVREISMMAFNRFWQRYKRDLRPTAGYPEDARRFLRDIAQLTAELKIPDDWIRRAK